MCDGIPGVRINDLGARGMGHGSGTGGLRERQCLGQAPLLQLTYYDDICLQVKCPTMAGKGRHYRGDGSGFEKSRNPPHGKGTRQ